MTPAELDKRLAEIQKALADLYQPNPREAMRQRPHDSFELDDFPLPLTPTLTRLWTSQALDTHGFTTQNCFAEIVIHNDPAPDGQAFLYGVLEGAFDSPFVEIDINAILYTGRGTYDFDLLRSGSSLATQIRFALFGRSGAEDARTLRATLTGALTSGYSL
jgi:hypothetical protein